MSEAFLTNTIRRPAEPSPIGELIDLVKEGERNRAQRKRGERALVSDAEAAQLEYTALLTEVERLRSALTAAGNLQVGSFTLRASPDPNFILMRHESGEGGSFKTTNLEQALFKFFGEQF